MSLMLAEDGKLSQSGPYPSPAQDAARQPRWHLASRDILFALVVLASTVQYSVFQVWPREISLVEIALLLWIGVEAMRGGGLSPRRMPASGKWMGLLILGLAVWAGILWLVGLDWRYNLNEVRWLLLSVPAFVLLLSTSEQEIARRLAIVLVIAVVAALVADLQGVTGAFPPPFAEFSSKQRWLSSDMAVEGTVAVGLFRHSNMYGGFIFWPLMISIGGVMQKGKRWVWALGVIFFGASLYLSYYRGLLLGLGMALAAFTLIMTPFPRRFVAAGLVALPILMVLASILGYALKPSAAFFETLRYRINLWQDVLNFIRSDPWILAFGAGYHPGPALQFSQAGADPHNAYLYMLMHYGLPGVLILMAIMGHVVLLGWRAYVRGAMTQRPIMAALWAGLLAWFVTSLLDSRMTNSEWQVLFVLILALLCGFSSLEEGKEVGFSRTTSAPRKV